MVSAARRPRRAFTLVELLVVIGIIALLIGILLPTISRARQAANTTACMAAMRNLGQGLIGYSVENKASLPWGYYESTASAGAAVIQAGDEGDASVYVWWSVLRGYLRKGGNMDNSVTNSDGTKTTRFMAMFSCPNGHERDAGCDFGVNQGMMPDLRYETLYERHPINFTLLKPAKTNQLYGDSIIMWDSTELANVDPPFSRQYVVGYSVDYQSTTGLLANPKRQPRWRYRDASSIYDTDPSLGNSYPINPGSNRDYDGVDAKQIGNIRWRHGQNNSANFLFADGSVKTLGITRDYGTPAARGDVLRKYLRIKSPAGYSMRGS